MKDGAKLRSILGRVIYMVRWILYPVNIGLLLALVLYVGQFLYEDYEFLVHGKHHDLEAMMVLMLGFVDASMVANLIVMIVQGSHQIFIHKFELPDKTQTPQYLDNIDTGILKVKVALSISSITLVQILKDFVNIDNISWDTAVHRMWIHGMALMSALIMAIIWRVMHPPHAKDHVEQKDKNESDH